MEKFNIVGRSSRCAQSTNKYLYLSHSLLVTSLKKKKPYNNINIWRYRHKGGDISASIASAYSYVVVKRAGKVEKAKYNPKSYSYIA